MRECLMADLDLETRLDGGVARVRLAGNFDAAHAPRVQQALVAVCDCRQPVVLVLMAELHDIDSAGLNVLLGALKQVSGRGGRIALVQPSPFVSRILRVTALDKVFSIYADEAQARAAFSEAMFSAKAFCRPPYRPLTLLDTHDF